MTESVYLRRQPQQVRGQQRVSTILNAAEAVFAEQGYNAATTNAIAARAETNIASLYQFFPNKEAILAGVVARYRAEYDELAERVFSQENLSIPLPVLVDQLTEEVLILHQRHGVPRPFFVGVGGAAGEFAPVEHEVYAGLMRLGDQALRARYPALDAAQRKVALQIILRLMQALIHLADLSPEAEKRLVVAGLKIMLHAYLDALE